QQQPARTERHLLPRHLRVPVEDRENQHPRHRGQSLVDSGATESGVLLMGPFGSTQRHHRGQSGLSLLEVVFVAAVIGLLATTVAAWSMATMVSSAQTRASNEETAALSLVNSHMLRDITSAQFG